MSYKWVNKNTEKEKKTKGHDSKQVSTKEDKLYDYETTTSIMALLSHSLPLESLNKLWSLYQGTYVDYYSKSYF